MEARAILTTQGQLNADSYKLHKVKTIKLLCKWKQIKTDNLTRKEQLFDLCMANPEPPPREPWTEEEEPNLQKLQQPDMPLHKLILVLQQGKWLLPHPTMLPVWTVKLARNCSNLLQLSIEITPAVPECIVGSLI